jgi:hypothetical protein
MSFQMKSRTDTTFFWDGVRRIDMILAYEDDDPEEVDTNEDAEDFQTKAQKREQFEKNLVEQGLELELEPAKVRAT